jgi:dimethylamine/trimethylamine dehydrogenase
VVCTEEVEIHHSTDLSPYVEGRLWSDEDIPALALVAQAVHRHGALAGVELTYNSFTASNLYSRAVPFGSVSRGLLGGSGYEPGQSRRADRDDLRRVRTWHRNAAVRAKRAGFDIVYVYAAHGLSLAMHLLLPRYNDRTDEYGGSLENRVRFTRELLEETREAVGDQCAVALRFAVDELMGADGLHSDGEAAEIVSMLAELPDLWDVNLSGWAHDSAPSRFEKEGFQEKYIAFVKGLTTKPVVGVGRYTSPEAMVAAVRDGIMDLVGAARPSIADPFLPQKIREGRVEDIRECIGCNICVTGDTRFIPIRCTQNPSMGEEWRRGWHPEVIPPRKSDAEVLVVGAGPAGLEAARALGQRGYRVVLTEAERELGGRARLESQLPGLSEWRRVIDWRLTQIEKMPDNVFPYLGSRMSAADVLESGLRHVVVATGATWRRDAVGRSRWSPLAGEQVFTPDDLMSANLPAGRVLLYDDDHYYMGSVLAELLAGNGCQVTLVTPAPMISYWTKFTLERERIEARLARLGVELLPGHALASLSPGLATISRVNSETQKELPCEAVVLVTDRVPEDGLYRQLKSALAAGKLDSLRLVGDAEAPNIIAQAVFSGHLAAREFDEEIDPDATPFRVEKVEI